MIRGLVKIGIVLAVMCSLLAPATTGVAGAQESGDDAAVANTAGVAMTDGLMSDAVHPNGRLAVASIIADGAVIVNLQSANAADSWGAPKVLGGCAESVAMHQNSGRLVVAAIGCGGRAAFVRSQTSPTATTWTPWLRLGGCVESFDMHNNANGRAVLVAVGCGGKSVFTRVATNDAGTTWSPWASLGGCVEEVEVHDNANGRLTVAAIGCGSRSVFVRTQTQTNGANWSPWASLGGCAEQIDLESGDNAKMTLAAIGCGGNAVFVRSQTSQNATTWSAWQGLAGCARQIDLGQGASNRLTVAAVGCGGNTVFERTQGVAGGTAWAGWRNLGGCVRELGVSDRVNGLLTSFGLSCIAPRLVGVPQAGDAWGNWFALNGASCGVDTPNDGFDQDCDGFDLVVGSGAFRVTLLWGTRDDLDLHIIDPDGARLYFGNRGVDSGGTLDRDDNVGTCGSDPVAGGIESGFWDEAPGGVYTVQLYHYTNCGFGSSQYEIKVYIDDILVDTISGVTNADNEELVTQFQVTIP